MMDYPLTIRNIYERARLLFGDRQLATRRADGTVARTTYADWAERVARLATALRELGVEQGDRVATFCWNHDRHMESYFAAALMGASYHTLNIRLSPDQLAYIVNHAHDKVVVVDADLAPAIARVLPQTPSVEHVLVIGADAPAVDHRSVHDYEALVSQAAPLSEWPELDEEQTAGICYTSATTGNPKGVAFAAGVPTVWLGVAHLLEQDGGDLGSLQRIVCGGSAAPVSMIRMYEQRYGVEFIHAYGMTEATPLTHLSRL